MNPIHQLMCIFISCKKRKCPTCGTVRVVEKSRKFEKVKCKKCGEILYPQR